MSHNEVQAPTALRRLLWRGRLMVVLFLLLTGGGLGAAGLVMHHVSTRMEALDLGQRENVTWMISQVEADAHRLRATLSDALLDAPTSGHVTQEAAGAVHLAVDLFASRVDLLKAPALEQALAQDPDATRVQSDLTAFIAVADRGLAKPVLDVEAVRVLRADIDALLPRLHSVTVNVVHYQAAVSAGVRADLRMLDSWTRGVTFALLLILAMTVTYLLIQRVALRDTVQRLATTARTLEESSQRADQANRAKSAFLASMSHELRTPLNAILGFSDLMKAGIWGPLGARQYDEYAASIHDAGSHLLELVNDILDLARIEAGRLQLAEARLAVAACLEEAVSLVNPDAERRQVALRVDLRHSGSRDGVGMLIADPLRLRQILLNLLGNALKFTPPGGTVTAMARCLRDGRLAIAIRDTGCGMRSDEIATALEPFGQVNRNPHLTHEGVGLGLPLSRSLMEVHGGTLYLRSRVGRGTMAVLLFPRWRVVAAAGAE